VGPSGNNGGCGSQFVESGGSTHNKNDSRKYREVMSFVNEELNVRRSAGAGQEICAGCLEE
ncbi:MAG: hypothetical protein QOE88_2323, partial [Verrucomicrobiota bacterium]|nr:hypothetical protein [Verrucomicrobiota bacterium]